MPRWPTPFSPASILRPSTARRAAAILTRSRAFPYEAFLDFHRRLYHPSNSYIFIYGDGDIAHFLEHIDSEYLSHYDRAEVDSSIDWQPAFAKTKKLETFYSVAPDAETAGKDILAYAVSMGTRKQPADIFVEEVLAEVLVESQAGPVKNALLAAGIGEDISAFSNDGLQIPFASSPRRPTPPSATTSCASSTTPSPISSKTASTRIFSPPL